MINIQRTGNAIVVDFTDNDKYLNNGTIEVAPNELMVVIDESNMATFKKMSNGDTLFGQLIDQIQIQGENVTKDNIIEKFGIIGFSISGGEAGAVNSVNGQTGDVVITATSLGAITKANADAAYASKTELEEKQDTLVSGTNIKTINGQSVIGSGNIEIQGGELPIATADTLGGIKVGAGLSINPDTGVLSTTGGGTADSVEWDNVLSKPDDIVNITERLAAKLDTATYNSEKANFALKSELPDTSTLATKSEVTSGLATKLDVATYNVDKPTFALKTEIPNISGLATKTELSGKLDTATYNSEKASFETKENAAATYQVKGDYATTAQLNSKQDTLVSGTNIKTINGNSLLGEGDLAISSEARTWRFTYSSSITFSDFATITPDGFNSQEWLSQVAIGDMVQLEKGQEFMKLSVSNIYHPTTGNIVVGLSFYSDRLYWVFVTGNNFSLKIHTVPIGETSNATSLGQEAAVTAPGSYGVAIGKSARSNGYNAIVIGNYISEDEQLSINIGDYLKVSYANGFSYWDGTQMQSLKDQLATLTPPTVDTEMSDTSKNAVQNKVIKKYIDDLVGNILTQLQEINGTN